MIILGWILLLLNLLYLLTALTNLIWGRLIKVRNMAEWPGISVLIPARNEADNIGTLLNDLLAQDYPLNEIIVFNDESTDETKAIVEQFAAQHKNIKLINSEGLPECWLGKNHACHVLAQKASAELLLFIDADVRLKPGALKMAISAFVNQKAGLLSVFPKQLVETRGEWLTVPLVNYLLMSLLPVVLVRHSWFTAHSAANGQFLLFNRQIYKTIQPHQKFKQSRVEDMAIARYFKKSGIPVSLYIGNNQIACRMYPGFNQAVTGFSKNLVYLFGNSAILAIIYWLTALCGIFLVWPGLGYTGITIYLFQIILLRFLIAITSYQSLGKSIAYHYPQLIVMGFILYQSIKSNFTGTLTWKGRNI